MSETYLESIQKALHRSMKVDGSVIIIGEDILDPYGGAYKVTKGLSDKYPDRVLATPISEGAIVGVSTGLAIRGFKPVAEIMFGDFLALGADQILNSATKFGEMYQKNVTVPIVIRTPMGGGKGYGPTHSQSIEKMFFGVPGLKVISPSLAHDPGELLFDCILKENEPVLYIEYKNLYDKRLIKDSREQLNLRVSENKYPLAIVENFIDEEPDAVILGYGGVSHNIIDLLKEMQEEEINLRAVFPSLINQAFNEKDVSEYLGDTDNILITEMGGAGFNWGSEIFSSLYETKAINIRKAPIRLSSKNTIIPASKELENHVLLGTNHIRDKLLEMLL